VQTLSAELVGIRCVVQPHSWCWACKGPWNSEFVLQTRAAELVGIRCVVQPWLLFGSYRVTEIMGILQCAVHIGAAHRVCWGSVTLGVLRRRGSHGTIFPKVCSSPWGSPKGLLGQCELWVFYGAVAATAPYFQKCAVPVGDAQRVCWGSVNFGGFTAPWQPRHHISKSVQFPLGQPKGFVGAALTLGVLRRRGSHGTIFPKVCSPRWGSPKGLLGQCELWGFYGAVAATAPHFQKCAVPVGAAQRVCWGSVNSGGFTAPWQPRHHISKSVQFPVGQPKGFVGAE